MSDWKLLNTSTASGASSVSFTDLTGYKIFKFVFVDVNPSNIDHFVFQASTDSGSTYGVTLTSTFFNAEHGEGGSPAVVEYETASDLAQSTSFQRLFKAIQNDADSSGCGELHIFNPASTTYVKHWHARCQIMQNADDSADQFSAGYFNTTSAVDALQFKMGSGTFSGTIKQYGLVES